MEGNMFRIHIIGLLAAAALCGQDRTPRKLIASMEGKDLFKAYCASCHGLDGKGKGPAAPALKEPLPDLTTFVKRNGGAFPREEMEKMILGGKGSRVAHGSEEMPVWGPVFRKVENDRDFGLIRVRRLVDYLDSLQTK
jgi:mono/diheme cytochrome c family protein